MKKSLSFVAFLVILSLSSVIADTWPGKIFKEIKKIEKVSEGVVKFVENELNIYEPWFEKTSERGWILNKEGKKALENLLLTLPCGWPQYGIPPLAPYTNEQLVIDLKKSILETLTKLKHFRIDGLDILLINELKISYAFHKKVKYSITFPKLVLSGKIDTDTLLSLMMEYGISVRFDGKGDFEMILENIIIDDFLSVISLGNVTSGIRFEGTFKKLNEFLNAKIQDFLMRIVNNNKNPISDWIEETIVPFINDNMKGKKIWHVIGMLAKNTKPCYPPHIPWEKESKDGDNKV
ncbi:uncharacterized protein LOC129913615 isoform X2 [Episyrphus balteatus]|uniref:uncharacterized protein LOC129913615 isoform X2 n=1 Tax=Episyrphus balteatus TaxID=286459 RepID=UPI002485A11F|nr:uncharacterized protein LOC129913615 isoform X2 [Episyrphus balteatus]